MPTASNAKLIASIADGLSYFDGSAPIRPEEKPRIGEKSGPQLTQTAGQNYGSAGYGVGPYGGNQLAGMSFSAMGGSVAGLAGTAYPGIPISMCGAWFCGGLSPGGNLVLPTRGNQALYRIMSLHPTLNLIYSIITGPIAASQWTVKASAGVSLSDDDEFHFDDATGSMKAVPQSAIDFISSQLLPKRHFLIRECLRYLASGWRPFEKVWLKEKRQNGWVYLLDKLKPLLPDTTYILGDSARNYAGLQGANSALLAPSESLVLSNNSECGNLHGFSRHESAYDTWLDSNITRLRKAILAAKISGNLPIMYYRPGRTPIKGATDADGRQDNGVIADMIMRRLFAGEGVSVPTTEYEDIDLQSNPELAKLAPWKIDIVDSGSYTPAIDGLIRESQYQDTLLIRSWGWPERAVIEGTHGTKAEASVHTDTAELDRELIDDDIAEQISHGHHDYNVPGVVDDLLWLNYGEEARGSITLKPAPLVDEKVAVYTDLLKTAMGNPELAPIFASIPDWEDVFSHLDIASAADFKGKINDVVAEGLEAQKQQKAAADKQTATNAQKAVGAASRNKVSMNEPKKKATEE
jgi:hypothetical protein